MARRSPCFSFLLAAAVSLLARPAPAQERSPGGEEDWSLHFQSTVAFQAHDTFHALYSGRNSLVPVAEQATSVVSDAWATVRLWRGAIICADPEMAGGYGLSTTLGVAAFPSGEVYRVGDPAPGVIMGRLYLRQTFDLGGERVRVESGPCQVAGTRPHDALTITAGRVNEPDQIDNNPVSNDPHTRFTSWGLWASAAYDYPADTRGFTWGVIADYTRGPWSLRGAALMEPAFSNGMPMDGDVLHDHGLVVEGERRWEAGGRPGAVRLLLFDNFARMGSYAQALAAPPPDVTRSRQTGRQKYGFAASANQDFGQGLAAFARASWDDGATETWAFAEIDRSLALGAVQTGGPWGRESDVAGVAAVACLLSDPHREYLAEGGYGFIIGDGALLHYGPELLGEVFYQATLTPNLQMGLVYQPVVNPAYNQDRGPVHIAMLRVQAAF